MSKLKPCPFCGSPEVKIATDCGVVECSRCNSYSCSAEVWNTRAKGIEDKHTIIANHLNVLAECIMAVPVPEYGREHNIKMRDSILNVMASSVAAYQVEPADLKNKAVEALRQAIQDCEESGRVWVKLNGEWAKGHQQVTGVVVDDVGDIVIC